MGLPRFLLWGGGHVQARPLVGLVIDRAFPVTKNQTSNQHQSFKP